MKVLNTSGYCFTQLNDLDALRKILLDFCAEKDLKGTILLSHEGINLMLAGTEQTIAEFKAFLLGMNAEFEAIHYKDSYSDYVPYRRMVVKVKPECITFKVEDIDPSVKTGDYIKPETLKSWYDTEKPFTVLDTRNDFEVAYGKFAGAVDLNIKSFKEFADAVTQLDEDTKAQPLVMYCTGGIRCEKASAHLLNQGFKEVYQLDGGILNYFEQCGGAHWEGECFVFDDREALDPTLNETDTKQCTVCRYPVTEELQQSDKYIPGKSCPRCEGQAYFA